MNQDNQTGTRRDAVVLALSAAVQAAIIIGMAVAMTGCELPPVETSQDGFRGTGMVDVQSPETIAARAAANVVPAALPAVPAAGPKASAVYQNVKVLGDVSVGEFTRLMVAMTNWVSPTEGCAYCHNPANMASDEKYAKVVSRRMIEMTQHINADWKTHVSDTGVTCHTCHRGNPVPEEIWFTAKDSTKSTFAGNRAGQNAVSMEVALASLPLDPFTTYFASEPAQIRVGGTQALPHGNASSIKQAEWTYGLMMHFSQSLGVNCTYCHNSRQFGSWEQSPPTRAQAWHGIEMVRALNVDYLVPLRDTFPENRRGPTGDAPKVYCATCHQGASKPLAGAKMLVDYAALAAPMGASAPAPASDATPAEPAPAAEASASEPVTDNAVPN